MKIANTLGILLTLLLVAPMLVFAGTSGPAPIPPPPAFQLSTALLTLCRGVVNNVQISVSNPGSQPMTSMQLGLVASRNIYGIGNGTVNQATVAAGNTTTVNLPIFVSLNTSSLVSVGITINYNYFTLYSDSEIRNVSFGVQTCTPQLAVVANHTIVSGKVDNIVINLTNTGSTMLNAISASVSIPAQDAAVLSTQPKQLGSLAPGKSKMMNVSAFVYRNATQSFPLNVSVSLYNGTKPVQMLSSIQMLSTGIINMTPSSITISPISPTPGSIFSASFILTDIGTVGASAVTATALPPAGISAYGSNSVFVGDMAADTQTPVTITLLASGSLASGAYNIPIRINYLNNLRQNQSAMINVPLRIAAGSNLTRNGTSGFRTTGSKTSTGFPLFEIVLVLIIFALLILYNNERKKARRSRQG